MSAEPEHARDRGEYEQNAHSRERGTHPGAPDRGIEAFLHRFAIAFALQILQGEGLNRLDRIQGFAGETAGVGDTILRCA
jgi:hypothetical protein